MNGKLVRVMVVFGCFLAAACSSTPEPQTPEPAASATPDASAAAKPPCEDDQSCVEQGALAMMVGNSDQAKEMYKLGCKLKPDGNSCKKLAELK